MHRLLILFLLSPEIFAQRYGKSNDPNDEPFLPIFPVYPYSPKLIKRGTEKETVTQLTPELYAPKIDARDSYSASYSTNYPRDPYYLNYNPYSKSSTPSTYSAYYASAPYSYSNAPYNAYSSYSSPYSMTAAPYATIPYSAPSYPSYFYQPPYYYPHHYNHPLFPPPPPPPPSTDYSGSKDSYADSESNSSTKSKKSGEHQNSKDNDLSHDSPGSQFVDGANYISTSSKDLDSQPSTYKATNPYNQLEQVSDVHVKNVPLPLPKTTYRVISVAGQPVDPDYPLPAPYVKAQQLEQLMSQTLTKLLTQNSQQQQATQYPAYETNQNVVNRPNDASYTNQDNYNKNTQTYVSLPTVLAKTGLAYVINPTVLTSANIGQLGGQVPQGPTTLTKSTKYSPLTRVNLDQSSGVYVPPSKTEKDQTNEDANDYSNYDNPSPQVAQNYGGPLSLVDGKQEQNYGNEQGQAVSYQNQNFVTVQKPEAYSYQYSNYNPLDTSAQQQSQQYKTNLDDVNFGAKQTNKG